MGPNSVAITSDTYAEAMVKYLEDVRKLMEMDARRAFDVLLHIGPCAHGDREDRVSDFCLCCSSNIYFLLLNPGWWSACLVYNTN